MSPGQIIVLATPAFAALMALELLHGLRLQHGGRGTSTYRLNDAISSLSLGVLSQITALFSRLLRIGLYTAVYASLSLVPLEAAERFWTSWAGWPLALLFYDFCYYWLHRLGHERSILWAAHVVHHQSQRYNLSTALRQTSSGTLFAWIFYLPMAIAGVPPLVFVVVGLIDLLYQFWVHTEHVGRLGWFDRWFCSPSNHRVHHAVNDAYVDRNYGGVLIIWDRLFGTFTEENPREPCVYGTRKPLDSWDPLLANVEVYGSMLRDSWHARDWRDKLRVWIARTGWRPDDVAKQDPRPAFELVELVRYDPPLARAQAWFASVQLLVLTVAAGMLLWTADQQPLAHTRLWCAALVAAFWALGGVVQGRLSMLQCLAIEAAALASVSSALGSVDLYRLTKPAVVTLLVADLWASHSGASPSASGRHLLAGALAASLLGDVLLMIDGYFVPGLVAFLLAHLCYLALFMRGAEVFPRRDLLATFIAIGATFYLFLWLGGLPATLRPPVAIYVAVIALMAAQASGRASTLRDAASLRVATGAGLFMLSDALLSTDRFVVELPLAPVWVLAIYFAAQVLITANVLRPRRRFP